MASFTQDKRPLRVTTGLGKDVLLLERFSGEEGVSTPFHFVLDMLSENSAIAPADVLRKLVLRSGLPTAIGVDGADAGLPQALNGSVSVLGTVADMRPVKQRGDAGVDRA